MTKPKNPESNPIEDAIGPRAKPQTPSEEATKEMTKLGNWDANTENFPQHPSEIPDVPSPSEMLTLEELNRRTEERLLDHPENRPMIPPIPASKPDLPPATTPSFQASPPQKIENPLDSYEFGTEKLVDYLEENYPAEDRELTALKKYIFEDGFVVSTVAFHIVTLCSQPLVTPSTTTWDFVDRAMIPEMVFALLNQPGYLEGVWPSLRIVMGSNKGNSAWTAGISTTIAFFDVIRTLPAIEDLKDAST